ncbi:MAG: hypothetical protein RLY86_3182 [Pseudomonadota bacterium]|jgi:HTH-type transcriptional regulator/antitoxin HigA
MEGTAMNIRPLRNEDDYTWALNEIAAYFDNEPEPGTPAADRFDVLADLIAAYEAKHWPIEAPDPVSVITAYMEAKQLRQADLAALLGSRPRASEVLARKRALTMDMAWKLHQSWHIPASALIRPYHVTGG